VTSVLAGEEEEISDEEEAINRGHQTEVVDSTQTYINALDYSKLPEMKHHY